jgi:arylsulfatase A-like enzyme
MWEHGSGNYHMGYTGFEFIRGIEADAYYTAPVDFDCPDVDRYHKNERHWRNVHYIRQSEEDYFCAQVFQKASDWLERNQGHEDFYLHLDIFDPHEPWDPPEEIVKRFDPKGYDIPDMPTMAAYASWPQVMTPEQFNNYRARYAAKVVFLDRWLGKFLDTMDRLDLWKDTIVILTTDHGTFNGDHGRMGKLQTHEFDAKAHIPFILAHPTLGQGERRSQLIQLVDIFPTVLSAVGRPLPEMPEDKSLHGKDLLSIIENPNCHHRDYAVMGMFGKSVSISDGEWILHQSPNPENQPLNWYGYCLAKFLPYDLGPYQNGCRTVSNCTSWDTPTWLSHKPDDPNELINRVSEYPVKVREMQHALRETLRNLKAPPEQIIRLGIDNG